MDKFATNLQKILEACTPYTWVLAAAALIIIGVMFIIPSDESHAKAKKALPFVIIGIILVLGCVYLGKWFAGKVAF